MISLYLQLDWVDFQDFSEGKVKRYAAQQCVLINCETQLAVILHNASKSSCYVRQYVLPKWWWSLSASIIVNRLTTFTDNIYSNATPGATFCRHFAGTRNLTESNFPSPGSQWLKRLQTHGMWNPPGIPEWWPSLQVRISVGVQCDLSTVKLHRIKVKTCAKRQQVSVKEVCLLCCDALVYKGGEADRRPRNGCPSVRHWHVAPVSLVKPGEPRLVSWTQSRIRAIGFYDLAVMRFAEKQHRSREAHQTRKVLRIWPARFWSLCSSV